jgi:RNA polymerase sigma-70 factor (ECF subfamily)
MQNSSFVTRLVEILPEEVGSVRQARSGDISAFIRIYEAYIERIYRYVYFFVPNTRTAQVLASKVFFKAWENLGHYRVVDSSFAIWLYSIARNQVIDPFLASGKNVVPDTDFVLAAKGGDLREDFQIIRLALRGLTPEQQQVLVFKFIVGLSDNDIAHIIDRRVGDVCSLQMHGLQTLTEHLKETRLKLDGKGFQRVVEKCLTGLSNGTCTLHECETHYPEYANQLIPLLETALLLDGGRSVNPISTFREYTHDVLIQYTQSHSPRRQNAMPMFQRTALTLAVLVVAFLITGTAHAQSALPGGTFYGWKRTSEQVWRILSPDPLTTDIILAERRLKEWVAVAGDPIYNVKARFDYLDALARLETTGDMDALTRIIPVLQLQQQILAVAGLPAPELDTYLVEVAATLPADLIVQIVPTVAVPAETEVPTEVSLAVTEVPTNAAPAETETPTVVAPTGTQVPTVVVPTETQVPTVVVPTETEIVTETAPAETEVPTETVAVETEAPTETVPTETEAPTESVPVETEVPTEVVPIEAPSPEVPSEIAPIAEAYATDESPPVEEP